MSVTLRPNAPRFLVLRHMHYDPGFYDIVLEWIRQNHPEYYRLFHVQSFPNSIADDSNYVLHIPWLQDPVQNWSEGAYAAALQIAEVLDRRGVPIVNRVDKLVHCAKSEGARRIARAGLRTPKMARIDDAEAFRETLLGIPLPLFVREDWGHGGPIVMCETRQEALSIELDRFRRPVAVEFMDIRDPSDGLFRKYRYIAAGNIGVCHHLIAGREWITKGSDRVIDESTRSEELAYVGAADPFHDRFQDARRQLELEFVAFDYGIGPDGMPIVWEANPYPLIKFGETTTRYRNHAIHRTILAMLTLYLEMGGQKVPDRFYENLAYPASAQSRHA